MIPGKTELRGCCMLIHYSSDKRPTSIAAAASLLMIATQKIRISNQPPLMFLLITDSLRNPPPLGDWGEKKLPFYIIIALGRRIGSSIYFYKSKSRQRDSFCNGHRHIPFGCSKRKEEERQQETLKGFERCAHSRVNDDIKVVGGGGYFEEGAKKEKSHKRMKKKRTPIKVLQVGIFLFQNKNERKEPGAIQ